jgi:hypothetical protein
MSRRAWIVAGFVAVVVIVLAVLFPAVGSAFVAGATVVYAGLTWALVSHTRRQAATAAESLTEQRQALEKQYESVQSQIETSQRQVQEAANSNVVATQMYEEVIRGRLDLLAPQVTVVLPNLKPTSVIVRHNNAETDERPVEIIIRPNDNWTFQLKWQVVVSNHGAMPVRVWLSNMYASEEDSGHQYLEANASRSYLVGYNRGLVADPGRRELITFVIQFTDVAGNIQDTHTLQFDPPMFRQDGNVLYIEWDAKANTIPIAQFERDYVFLRKLTSSKHGE